MCADREMLDDDDEWLPDKLEVQLKLAHSARAATPIVASRLTRASSGWLSFTAPRRVFCSATVRLSEEMSSLR